MNRWLAMDGLTRAQWEAMPNYTWRDSCHPDDAPVVATALRQHFAGISSHCEAEYRHCHTDGRWVWVWFKGKMLSRSVDGKPEIITATLTDITERKEAQARVVELNATLERRVAERTEQLEAAMHTLRQSQPSQRTTALI